MITTVLPIFLVILVGFIFGKKENFTSEAEKLINSYVLNIALPALLFSAISQANIEELARFDFVAISLVGIFVAYVLGLAVAYIQNIKTPQSSLLGMSSCYGTTGYMGIPLVIVAFGTIAAIPAAIATILHNIPAIMAVIITYGVMEQKKLKKMTTLGIVKSALLTTLTNPLTISVLTGMLFAVSKITLPTVLITFTTFLGYAAGPTALFALGLGLARLNVVEYLRGAKLALILPIVFIKIIVQPLITFLLGYYLFNMNLDDVYFKTAIIMSALPVGAGVYVFANKYNYYETDSSVAIIISLIITLFTLSYILDML